MRLRSLLFVPGDRPDRFRKAEASGADAIILDLEDSVSPPRKDPARCAVADFLAADPERGGRRFVRINPLDAGMAEDDLAAAAGADGIVLPKAVGGLSVAALERLLRDDPVPILPIATETPLAVFALGSFVETRARLCGLTWGAEDLPAAIGAATSREPDGRYTPPYEVVRALALFGAHGAGVPAIETVFPGIDDIGGLRAYARRGARDGFSGMMAIHPTQVAVINEAFTPSDAEVAQARAVVRAFAERLDAGVLAVGGRMVDAPHLKQARLVLTRAGELP